MIKQNVSVNVGTMEIALGNGEVGVLVGLDKNESPKLVFVNLTENKDRKAGDKYDRSEIVGYDKENDTIIFPVVVSFDNMDALNVVKHGLEQVEKILAEKEAKKKAERVPRFTVRTDTLKVLSKFKNVNPSPEKIITCLTNYQKNGKLDRDIVVNCNKQIKDGYVAYLVAEYLGIKELTVVAPNGITGNFATGSITFTSENVHVSLGYDTEKKQFTMFIENVSVGYFDTIADASTYLKNTFEYQKLFTPKFVYDDSQFTKILEGEMKPNNAK